MFAQSGSMQGKVVDKTTKEPIPLANVMIELGGKMVNGGTTDFDGKYNIKPIPPGKYDVKITYVGYKKMLIQDVVINASKIRFLDVELESTTQTLDVFEVVEYKVPLIDKDQTSTGSTMTSEEIDKMPGRSAESVAVTVGGVFADENGSMGGIRGQREGGTATYIDGVRVVGSTSLPKSSIDQVAVITGGTPAMYGDFTGGVMNITTKGPSREFHAGFEAVTSELLDGYGYNLGGFSIQGPLLKGRDTTKNTSLLGFFISGEGSYVRDGSPSYIGTYKIKDDVLDYLRQNPVRPTGSGFGSFYNSLYVRNTDMEKLHTRINAEATSLSLAGKIDVRTTDYTNLTFGGSINYNNGISWSRYNSLFNYDNNGVYSNMTWRTYGRFTQRFPVKDQKALIKNVFYSIQADYSKVNQLFQNQYHKEDIFNYGYVGKFNTYTVKSYELGNDSTLNLNNVWIHNGFRDTLYAFTRSEINPDLSNYTDQYYSLYDLYSGYYSNSLLVQNGGALLNGQLPESVYGLWANTGTPYNGYQKAETTRMGLNINGSADLNLSGGTHELQFGFQYEQQSNSAYSINPAGLWTLMRGLTNKHILQLDLANPHMVVDGNGVFQDTVYYDRLYDQASQAFFDVNMRNKLGLAVDGLDWIDIDSYDPDMFSVDMFSADELLNSGNEYVSYFGYDHTGKKLSSKPSFEDFFTQTDENGNFTRAIGAYEPIYMAGYVQDQFSFSDLIFTIGLRVDRFDANQKVLKDPYLLAEAKTVKEVSNLGEHPSNMGDDYVVYVNDLYNPSTIVGYRNGDVWYNASGAEITDPTVLETAGGIAPYLLNPDEDELSPKAFRDYDPQLTFMPRIAFSFPISDDALFFAHYDVLTSRPTEGNRLNVLSYYFINQVGSSVISNPNLKPERTTDYELGFNQKLNNTSSLKFSAYYREFRDQIQAFRFTDAYPVSYISYNNIDFGTAKGLTVQYDMRRTKNVSIRATYTLQFANATGSSATSGINLVTSGQPNLRTLSPVSEDRNHTLNLIIDYRYGNGIKYNGPVIKRKVGDDKVKIIRLLENTGMNLVFFGGSGVPYSRQSNVTSGVLGGGTPILEGSINGSRLPWQFRMDLKIDRDIYFSSTDKKKGYYMNVYFLMLNVLNAQNVMGVYRYTGNPSDDGYLAADEYQSTINSYNDPISFSDLYSVSVNSIYNYSLPRRMRIGVSFNF